ncbi:hypothetical protein BHE74_00007832 [Ensete ventricosum]|nr:hypothetical protein GW17_00020641 [Ensete ventricosum]RWW83648.1 hypothetical protein BHE74_00007832 [Ensete ventricosum]
MASSPVPITRRSPGQLYAVALSRTGAAKAQAALAKIIAIISNTPAPTPPRPVRDAFGSGVGGYLGAARGMTKEPGFGVDPRLRLGLTPEIGGGPAEGDGPTAHSVVVDSSASVDSGGAEDATIAMAPAVAAGGVDVLTAVNSSEGECDPDEKGEGEDHREAAEHDAKKELFAEQEETKGSGEGEEAATPATTTTTTTTTTSSSSSNRSAGKDRENQGCLDLLLEAVRQVSGGVFEEGSEAKKVEPEASPAEGSSAPPDSTPTFSGGGGKKRWIPSDLDDTKTAPIVRSKRGRSQALPWRYRDSVLDPWRKPPALTRHGRAAWP